MANCGDGGLFFQPLYEKRYGIARDRDRDRLAFDNKSCAGQPDSLDSARQLAIQVIKYRESDAGGARVGS